MSTLLVRHDSVLGYILEWPNRSALGDILGDSIRVTTSKGGQSYTIWVPWPGKSYRPADSGSDRSSATPDPELVRAALRRILASRQFSRAESLCALLEYVTEQTLKGYGHELKEYRIGTEALGRRHDFDPKLDGIVRVQATKVRARLKEYYATDGGTQSIIIDLPKGSYKTEFRVRETAPSAFRFTWRIVVTALTMLVGVIALYSLSLLHNDQQFAAIPSIAVFPFVDLSPKKDQSHIAHAITDELINALRRSRGVRVVARNSIMDVGATFDVRQIGHQLRATVLLKGSVRRNLDKFAVTADLFDTHTGNRLWSTTLDSEFASISAAGQAITAGIAAQLGIARRWYKGHSAACESCCAGLVSAWARQTSRSI